MKKTSTGTKIKLAIFVMACLFASSAATAQKTVIHFWHFNNTPPAGGAGGIHIRAPYPADSSVLGHAAVWYTLLNKNVKSDTAGYMDNYGTASADSNAYLAYGSNRSAGSAVRTRNPSDSMQFLWYIPTTGYKNIVINYETQSSSIAHGQQRQIYDYSLDSGKTFIKTGLPVAYDSAALVFRKVVVNLSSIATINNINKLVFRITYPAKSSPNSTATSGNNRYDNIVIEGDSVNPKHATGIYNIVSNSGYSIYPNPSSDNVYINTPSDEPKTIAILNTLGQVVYVAQREGKQIPIHVEELASGFYYVKITGSMDNDKNCVLKFIKN